MFETTKPSQSAFAPGIRPVRNGDSSSDESWRMMGWSELAARINAARDLRMALKAGNGKADPVNDKDAVNRDALEGCKASAAIQPEQQGDLARGAKEIQND